MKFGNLELSDWNWSEIQNWTKGFVRRSSGMVFVGPSIVVLRTASSDRAWDVSFYNELYSLNKLFNKDIKRWDIVAAKRYVDEFLIRMSKLTAFA